MKRKLMIAGAAFCAALFLFSGIMLFREYHDQKQSAEAFEQVAALVVEDSAPEEPENAEAAEPEMTAFEKYAEVFAQNDDLIGWISIPGTRIDYPVMQTKDDPDFYLKHAFDKSYSNYGVPYAAENCDADISDNMVLYGHREHKTIYFDTLGGYGEYEVIAAFKTVAYSESGFKYYHFVNAESEAAFDEYVAKCKELSLYDTGASAAYGDKLITLSTCEYSQTNGRMVVVAKKISSPPVEVDRNEA